MKKTVVIPLAGLAGLMASLRLAPPQDQEAQPDRREIEVALLQAAERAHKLIAIDVVEGSSPEVLYRWSVRLLNASKLVSPEDVRSAYQAHLDRMVTLREKQDALNKHWLNAPEDPVAAAYFVHEARLWLQGLD